MRRIPFIPSLVIVATWLFAMGFALAYELTAVEAAESEAVAVAAGAGAVVVVVVVVVGLAAGLVWLASRPRRRLDATRG